MIMTIGEELSKNHILYSRKLEPSWSVSLSDSFRTNIS